MRFKRPGRCATRIKQNDIRLRMVSEWMSVCLMRVGHWGVENKLHWCLDVIFKEDHSKYRDRVGAQNFSAIRKISLGFLQKNPLKGRIFKR